MATQKSLELAGEIIYEGSHVDQWQDWHREPPRKLKDWPALQISVAEVIDKALEADDMKSKKAFITLTLARADVITVVEALKGHAYAQTGKGYLNDAAVSRHVADTIAEALKA